MTARSLIHIISILWEKFLLTCASRCQVLPPLGPRMVANPKWHHMSASNWFLESFSAFSFRSVPTWRLEVLINSLIHSHIPIERKIHVEEVIKWGFWFILKSTLIIKTAHEVNLDFRKNSSCTFWNQPWFLRQLIKSTLNSRLTWNQPWLRKRVLKSTLILNLNFS